MDMEYIHFLMEKDTKDNGFKTNNMEMEHTIT